MSTFRYFAYGSNMLTPRLTARCPSARPIGVYLAPDWRVDFTQRSRSDGSGKASIMQAEADIVHGVLFEIALNDRPQLDIAEGPGYDRLDDFQVRSANSDFVTCTTFIANKHEAGLKPYDWYLALIIAGAREHGLHAAYQKRFHSILHDQDARETCKNREAAIAALRDAGYSDASAVFTRLID